MDHLQNKHCFKCKITKSLDCFYKSKHRPDGVCVYCIECEKNDYKKNKQKINAKDKIYREKNKEKIRQKQKQWRQANQTLIKEYRKLYQKNARFNLKNSRLKTVYGINIIKYNEMLNNQNGVCAICLQPETYKIKEKTRDLSVDHCHITGKIRGLLCTQCNSGLGHFKDNEHFLLRASDYIKRHKSE